MKNLLLGGVLALGVWAGSQIQAQTSLIPGIYEYIASDKEPEALNLGEVQARIPYPFQAIRDKLSGIVIIRILIDAEGKYVQHVLTNRPEEVFVEAVLPYIEMIQFTPAQVDGQVLPYFWVNVPFRFQLNPDYKPLMCTTAASLTRTRVVTDKHKAGQYLSKGNAGLDSGNYLHAATNLGWSLRYQRNANARKAPTPENIRTALDQGISLNRLGKGDAAGVVLNHAYNWAECLKATHPDIEMITQAILIERAIARLQGGGSPAESVLDFATVAHQIVALDQLPEWQAYSFSHSQTQTVADLCALAPDEETQSLMAWVAAKMYCGEGHWALATEVLKKAYKLPSGPCKHLRITALMESGDYLTALNELEELLMQQPGKDTLLELKAEILNRLTLAQGR